MKLDPETACPFSPALVLLLQARQHIRTRRAFTLIELLVVIGIIGVLAAIVLPMFFTIRESSRRTVCLSNERQLGMAMFQYLGDNDDVFPPSLQDAGVGWAEECYRYVNNAQTFRCPVSVKCFL